MSFFKKLFGKKKPVQSAGNLDNNHIRKLVFEAVRKLDPDMPLRLAEDNDTTIYTGEGDDQTSHMDIGNLAAHLRAYPDDDVQETVERFARTALLSNTESEEIDDSCVMVALRPDEYVDHIKNLGAEIMSKPFMGDLHIVYFYDTPDAMRTLSQSDMGERTMDETHEIALSNIRDWFPRLVSDDSQKVFHLYYVDENNLLTSSMVLLDEFWEYLEERHGPEFLFALPRKDQFFVVEPSNPEQMDVAKWLINATWEDGFNLMSPLVHKRAGGKIEPVKAN